MINSILNVINSQRYGIDEYETYGLRVMKNNPMTDEAVLAEVGDCVEDYESYEWVDGNPTDETLGGLCASELDLDDIGNTIEKIQDYIEGSEQIVLIGSDDYERGNDTWNNEIICRDGKILATF